MYLGLYRHCPHSTNWRLIGSANSAPIRRASERKAPWWTAVDDGRAETRLPSSLCCSPFGPNPECPILRRSPSGDAEWHSEISAPSDSECCLPAAVQQRRVVSATSAREPASDRSSSVGVSVSRLWTCPASATRTRQSARSAIGASAAAESMNLGLG